MTSQRGAEFPQRDPKDVPQPRQKRSPNAWAIMPEEGGVPAEVASPTVKTPNKFLKSLINSGKISQADIDAAAEKGAGESLLKRAREALAKQQGGAAATTAGVTGEALDMNDGEQKEAATADAAAAPEKKSAEKKNALQMLANHTCTLTRRLITPRHHTCTSTSTPHEDWRELELARFSRSPRESKPASRNLARATESSRGICENPREESRRYVSASENPRNPAEESKREMLAFCSG